MIHMYYVMFYMCNATPHHSLYGCFRGVRYFVILVLNATFFLFADIIIGILFHHHDNDYHWDVHVPCY